MERKLALSTAVLLVYVGVGAANKYDEGAFHYGTFPQDFIWSSATSAYQIEGGWNADGKGANIWDTYTAIPGKIADNSSGAVACDSYNLHQDDIQVMKDMGVSYYRFSLSWARIYPEGVGRIEQKGLDYYHTLIDGLRSNNIEPMVTLYHWDLPQALSDQGGWLNDSAVDWFGEYARKCYSEFGPKVKYWITLNEPWIIAWLGYGAGAHAPGEGDAPGVKPYQVAHILLKAHARAYHIYKDEFKASQNGQVGMSFNVGYKEPKDRNNPLDVEAAERSFEFDLGWFANPVYVNGDYPEVMKERVYNKSMMQGLSQSRLPEFTAAEKLYNLGTSDFYGLNYYGGGLVSAKDDSGPGTASSVMDDRNTQEEADPNWLGSGSDWLKVTPWSLRRLLRYIKQKYNNPPVLITENGVSDRNGSLNDEHRIFYLKEYINHVLKAIDMDKCNVIGYTAWSLLDNFEWGQGYIEKFGLHYVNFSDPARPRVAKDSARFFKQLIMDNGFPDPNPSKASDKTVLSTIAIIVSMLVLAVLTAR